MTLKELREKLLKLLNDARDITAKAEKEERDFTDDERDQVKQLLEEARDVKADIKNLEGDDDMRKQIDDLGEGMVTGDDKKKGAPEPGVPAGQGESLGEQFVTSKEWLAWFKTIAPNGRIADSAKGISSPPVELKDLGIFGWRGLQRQKELLTGAGAISAGAFVESDRTGIYEPLGRYALSIRDLISVRTTQSDTIEFVRQTVQVAQAAPVAEANVTDYAGATGEISGEKPEGTMRFERVTESVRTIAVWIPATKRALSDAAQLRGLIDQELRDDLAEETEDQILNGSGVGENLSGLANTAGTLIQAFDTDIIVTTRKAITNLLINGKQMPTAWVLNPQDWETIDLSQDNDGRYYWGGPQAMGPRTLWGVPVVQSFFQPQGIGWLGNWSKAVFWDREQAMISVSDSHADFFIRNLVAILAELRGVLGIIRPSAFVEIDLEAGS